MADVFVSYQKSDRNLAQRVVNALAGAGYSVWWDDRLTPAESWDRLIEREIRAAQCVLVLWTERSVTSDWVRIEANFAKDSRPPKLVQARFDQCNIPMAYSLVQYADVPPRSFENEEAWRKVLEWIALFAGPRSGAGEINSASEAPTTRPAPPPKASGRFDGGFYWSGMLVALAASLLISPINPFLSSQQTDYPDAIIFLIALPPVMFVFGAVAVVLIRAGRLSRGQAALLTLFGGLRFGGFFGLSIILSPFLRSLGEERALTFDVLSLIHGATSAVFGAVLIWLMALLLGAFRQPRGVVAPLLLTILLVAVPGAIYLVSEFVELGWRRGAPFWEIYFKSAPLAILVSLLVQGLVLSLLEPVRVRRP